MTLLDGRYCIVGVGETEYSRSSGATTCELGVRAVRNAMDDAGLGAGDIDGMLSYHDGDSVPARLVAQDLGIRLDLGKDVFGGGSDTETLIGLAIGAIEIGMCHTVAVYRAMNGYSEHRIGGSPTSSSPAPAIVRGEALESLPYGVASAAQIFQFAFVRHMHEHGTTNEQLALAKVTQSRHASNNPKALYRQRVTVEDVLDSRWIVKPACHLLDCCVETDSGTCIIVTTRDRAVDFRHAPISVLGVCGGLHAPFAGLDNQMDPLSRQAGYYARDRVFGQAGIGPTDVDVVGAYDAFTFFPLMLAEAFGFCEEGAGGAYVASGVTALGGARPTNTSGGMLCEGYTHGMNLVIENVRQLRHDVDDSCSLLGSGAHTFDYAEGGCRQVRDPEVAMNLGAGGMTWASALVLGR